jgi:hypothetical protein
MTNLNILDTTPNRSEFTHALQFASKQQAMTFYKETNKELSC